MRGLLWLLVLAWCQAMNADSSDTCEDDYETRQRFMDAVQQKFQAALVVTRDSCSDVDNGTNCWDEKMAAYCSGICQVFGECPKNCEERCEGEMRYNLRVHLFDSLVTTWCNPNCTLKRPDKLCRECRLRMARKVLSALE